MWSMLRGSRAGIERPDQGEVWLGGERLDLLTESQRTARRRRHFGFVFQSGHLLAELPAIENVALVLMLERHPRRRAVAEAAGWFGPLGIDGLEHRLPGELSGGQAQRVTIARALVTRPSVVFADEPTAALDRRTGSDVVHLLVEATRASGSGLLIVTHDPEVARACDRVLVLRDGRMALRGERAQAPRTPVSPTPGRRDPDPDPGPGPDPALALDLDIEPARGPVAPSPAGPVR